MAYLNTAMFSVGTHKVTISSLDDHYSVSGYSSIVIKKK